MPLRHEGTKIFRQDKTRLAAEVFSYIMHIVLLINQKDYEHFNEIRRETVRL